MSRLPEFTYEAATALNIGQRERQEDAIAADFQVGSEFGFAVLADGMGGHAAGDMASKIVVTEVFSELKINCDRPEDFGDSIAGVLRDAAVGANDCVGQYPSLHPEAEGMGATLLAPVFHRDKLYWISVGDSPLYLFRDGQLQRLNQDHSLRAKFDALVEKGVMDPDEAREHPQRHCLTSVLIGQDIPKVDCTGNPLQLLHGDIVLAASDGLQFLSDAEIQGILVGKQHRPSADITAALLQQLEDLGDPDQDNIALCVIRVTNAAVMAQAPDPAPSQFARETIPRPRSVTLVASASRRKGSSSIKLVSSKL